MEENKSDDRLYVEHILEAIEKIEKFVSNEIDIIMVWKTIKEDLPDLKQKLSK